MFRNYLIVTFRNLVKNKILTAISVVGLTIAITSSVLIFQYVNFERSYDTTFENSERMYRVSTIFLDTPEQPSKTALSSSFLPASFKSDLPEIEANTQLLSTRSWFDCTIQIDEAKEKQVYNQRNLFFADSSFLNFFSVDLLSGDKNTALKNPNAVVLSQSTAKRYFGKTEPVGKIIHLKGSMQDKPYTVVGVMSDFPKNSHLNSVDILASLASVADSPALRNSFLYNYILVAEKHSSRDIVTRFQTFTIGKAKVSNANTRYELQALKDIYLRSGFTDEIHEPGNPETIGYLTILSVFILIVAWINYINLATARASERVKEIAVRKFSGASRRDLILQLLLESIIINLTAVALALVFIKVFSASIYAYIGIQNYLNIFQISLYSLVLAITTFFLFAFLAGFYPAVIISSTPVAYLKGKINLSGSNVNVRKTLVLCQFALCGFFLTCVYALNAQFKFMTNQDLKIKIANTLVLKAPSNVDTTYLTSIAGFKKQLGNLAIVNSVTTSSAVPGDAIDWQGDVRQEKDKDLAHNNFTIQVADHEFINSYHLKLLAGRNFRTSEFPDQLFGSKIESVIVNNSGSKILHFARPENAIGKIIYWGENRCRIIGVINDFHQRSLKTAIEPLLFTANYGPVMSIKLNRNAYNDNISGSVEMIRNTWKAFFPESPFDYFFLEDHFENQYKADNSFTTFFNLLCILTSFVSCIGLFGLSLHATKQRLKEIGIRKTLGASVSQIVILLVADFLKLVILSSLITLPITLIFIKIWIKNFAYHISLNLWLFILPAIFLIIIAMITVSFQTISAARTDPIKVLSTD
jgi:putative ABC transport system permease protein